MRKDRAGPIVACPTCGADAVFAPGNPHRPFCSERCRQVDLGAWATERFRVPTQPPDDDAEDHSVDPSRPTH